MEITINKRHIYELDGEFADSKDDYMFVKAKRNNKTFLIRKYYTNFSDAIDEQNKLKKFGINIPRIIEIDKKANIVVEEIPSGDNCFDILLNKDIEEKCFVQLFVMYRFCRFSEINIDYNPKNFVFDGKKIVYIGRHFWKMDKKRNLENYGIRYWLYTNEFVDYIDSLGIKPDSNRILPEEVANKQIVLLCVAYW
jgi:hypothetical protein